ncbi:PIG-L family deacetylase [Herpetosiphon giganteus]|uniref:PIG-L family deacetylase n=1 Tax=Herpetosiphon giganteus TaxID=2029754 RepID=UPI001958AA30|nr:PIG-L family deacetylase [Herpetosiphon giganteus]MBM7846012.1 mycothiol S-conjugate amidase [Herpetosiphon giganteus]
MHFPRDLRAYGIESHWLNTAPMTRRLLFVYAHPDDESFGNAGTIAYYAHHGVSVHYICATRGEAGDVDQSLLHGYGDIATLRATELGDAANAMGLAAYHFLNYRDSGMANTPANEHPEALVQAPVEAVAAKITAAIRAIQPQVVITFNEYGGYGHPDHIAIHHATHLAFERAGAGSWLPEQLDAGLPTWTPRKLYYSTFNPLMIKLMVRAWRLSGRDPRKGGNNGDVDFVKILDAVNPPTASVDCSSVIDQKVAAWQAHRSQLGQMALSFKLPRLLRQRFLGREQFSRVVPAPNGHEYDLFAGL